MREDNEKAAKELQQRKGKLDSTLNQTKSKVTDTEKMIHDTIGKPLPKEQTTETKEEKKPKPAKTMTEVKKPVETVPEPPKKLEVKPESSTKEKEKESLDRLMA